MTFKKGESGNSSGRPKGATGKKLNTFRQAIESRGEELINKALALALEGDTSMIKLCIDRILPAIKPKDEPIELPDMASKRNLAAKAKYVVDAVAVGDITASEGKDLLSGIHDIYKIKEYSELEKRIGQIEKNLKNE